MTIKIMNLFVLLTIVLSSIAIYVESYHFSQTSSTEDTQTDVLSKDDLALYRSIKKFQQQRVKRSVKEYFIELLIVVDQSMVDFHGKDLMPYVKAIMAGVQHRFENALFDGTIQFQVTDILQLNSEHANIDYANITSALSSFCAWKQRALAAQHTAPHDAALLMTRVSIIGNICNRNSLCLDNSCGIVADIGVGTVNTITHSLGHVMGAQFDESSFCQLYYGNSTTKYIMTNQLESVKQWWKWSECSINTLTERLGILFVGKNKCLTPNPEGKYLKLNADQHFLGQLYSLDKQCELKNRSRPLACEHSGPCERLRCKMSNDSSVCFHHVFPWADGTDCGAGKWCENGECVQADQKVIQRLKESDWTHSGGFDLKMAQETRVTTPIVIILFICLLVCIGLAVFGIGMCVCTLVRRIRIAKYFK